ncbi:hypothetical protein LMG18090_01224 [Ralstonia mannitolilytica]|uniref:hypothetical protein n=1 Tax=Ralstonia mannitolilytica TaxID=105219 RepID=UPI0028F6242E|nr:hypothetical protein [Ralstonia mannitolilytica]CAJ0780694.1 hypothetical protein LMG18090_01224 [Ralstonia mannitolilytica]
MAGLQREATRLLYKALHLGLTPANDLEYRELLARYRADGAFAETVEEAASGLELTILDVSERGLIVAPSSRESRFSLRLTDLRQHLSGDQKVALAMAHLAISAVFFPTTDRLEDDAKTPLPATVGRFRDTLLSLVNRLADAGLSDESAEEFLTGWALLKRLPPVNPKAERAATNSVEGFVKLALKQMAEYGLVRLERVSEDEAQTLYTATHRLRVHLRELTLPRLFELTRESVTI